MIVGLGRSVSSFAGVSKRPCRSCPRVDISAGSSGHRLQDARCGWEVPACREDAAALRLAAGIGSIDTEDPEHPVGMETELKFRLPARSMAALAKGRLPQKVIARS